MFELRLIFVVVMSDGHGFQIFSLKNLIAIQATDVIHAVSPGHDFSAGMLAYLHKIFTTYSMRNVSLVKPPGGGLFGTPALLPSSDGYSRGKNSPWSGAAGCGSAAVSQ